MIANQILNPEIMFLSHADSDLSMLWKAINELPDNFPPVSGLNLQRLTTEEEMSELLQGDLAAARIIVLRFLGRPGAVPGFDLLLKRARERGQHIVALSGVGELNPELACLSTVSPLVLQETQVYLSMGGVANLASALRYLSDHLLLTGFGSDPPQALSEHGIYHPDLAPGAGFDDWSKRKIAGGSTIGIVFYRAHFLSGNTGFIDALVAALEGKGFNVLPVYTSSLRATGETPGQTPAAFEYFLKEKDVDTIINTTSFSMAEIDSGVPAACSRSLNALIQMDVPVFQAVLCGMPQEAWENSSRGLNPLETAMNVVMPEFDGRIAAAPISFKSKSKTSGLELTSYKVLPDRVERLVELVSQMVKLRKLDNGKKRIVFVFTNANAKASQIGNAVGLDSPASLILMLKAMSEAGYKTGTFPQSGDELIARLIDRCSYDHSYLTAEQCRQAIGRVSEKQYNLWFKDLSPQLQERMVEQWGAPPGQAYFHDGHLIIPGLEFGNTAVILQPPRGYGMDPNAIYHQPDLPPTHQYYAVYRWLSDEWKADAIVHVGKHGTLEWLPGKGVGLSKNCFPDALLPGMPLFYPFILNDPGEGAQAKRRSHAVLIDHLTPPMTTADTYGELAQLVQLVDEYYQVEMLDPVKLPLLQQQIWALVEKANLKYDLESVLHHELSEHEHENEHGEDSEHHHDGEHQLKHDHEHEHAHEHTSEWQAEIDEHGIPAGLSRMNSVKFSHLIQEIDGYLCELGTAQIRDGLHIFGQAPQDEKLVDLLCSLTRLPNLSIPSLQQAVAGLFGLEIGSLIEVKGARLAAAPEVLSKLSGRPLFTCSDAIEAVDGLCRQLFAGLARREFAGDKIDQVIEEILNFDQMPDSLQDCKEIRQVLHFACQDLVPNIARCTEEIDNLLRGLDGRYVPAGPSGSPTRGMAHILPTGRNFYSVDPRALPSQSAWRIGKQLAHEVIERHYKETGQYPESVSISIWGTSAMRTHGDDIAEILALLGVRPIWQSENRHINGIEVISLKELGRPRIDVTTRVSGFFRDAFPNLIELIDKAVLAVLVLDEPPEHNFVRKHYLADLHKNLDRGLSGEEAQRHASYRVFGCKPGSYGAGILPLINEGNWKTEADFAEAYVNWGGYAYTSSESGVDARDEFRCRLASVQIALHNQDNREHDIFDSDDYLQFHGGMIATIRALSGASPRRYFGDTHNPSRAVVRDLKEEALRVFRTRVVNPKWLDSIRRHGYKGGLELTATVDYLFGYDATAKVMDDWMYEQVADAYVFDQQMREFLERSNPWALNAITERLLEAAQRKMWSEPSSKTLYRLKQEYLSSEASLEARAEHQRPMQGVK